MTIYRRGEKWDDKLGFRTRNLRVSAMKNNGRKGDPQKGFRAGIF